MHILPVIQEIWKIRFYYKIVSHNFNFNLLHLYILNLSLWLYVLVVHW